MTTSPNPANDRILDQLVQDAQATEARMLPANGELTPSHIAHVKSTLAAYLESSGTKMPDLARAMRIPTTSLLRFASDDYDPVMDDLARRIDRWLKTITQPQGEPTEPRQMVTTEVVRKINAIVKQTYAMRSMAIIVGESGTSKTLALQHAAEYIVPGVYMHCTQEASRPGSVIKQLAKAMGVSGRYRNSESFNQIVESLQATPRMLFIDQADYLPFKSLNIFRDIHKLTRTPIILCGTEELNETLRAENPLRVQFARLISNRYNINDTAGMDGRPLFTIDEIQAFCTEMRLTLTRDALDEATEIVNVRDFGGLGRLCFVLLGAYHIAKVDHQRAGKSGPVRVQQVNLIDALHGMDDRASIERLELRRQQARKYADSRKVKTA